MLIKCPTSNYHSINLLPLQSNFMNHLSVLTDFFSSHLHFPVHWHLASAPYNVPVNPMGHFPILTELVSLVAFNTFLSLNTPLRWLYNPVFSHLFFLLSVSFESFAPLPVCWTLVPSNIDVPHGLSPYSLQVVSFTLLASMISLLESSPDLLRELNKVGPIIFTQMLYSTSPSKCSKLMSSLPELAFPSLFLNFSEWPSHPSSCPIQTRNAGIIHNFFLVLTPLSNHKILYLNSENISSSRPH